MARRKRRCCKPPPEPAPPPAPTALEIAIEAGLVLCVLAGMASIAAWSAGWRLVPACRWERSQSCEITTWNQRPARGR